MDRKEPQRVRRMFRARTLMLGQQFLHDKDNVSQFDREQKRLRPATLLFFFGVPQSKKVDFYDYRDRPHKKRTEARIDPETRPGNRYN